MSDVVGKITFAANVESEEDFLTALRGWRYLACLQELDQWLKNKIKNGDLGSDQEYAYTKTREELVSLMDQRGLVLWE